MEVPVDVSVVCVVVVWVVLLVLGEVCDGDVADGLDWSVDDGCCPELLGLVCATSHTLDKSRIDAIRYTFLI
jgi:hypothetical protein